MSADEDPLIDGRPLSELKVIDLKKELDKRNLSKSGVKNVLQERLKQYLIEQGECSVTGKVASPPTARPTPSPVKDATPASSNPLVAEYLAKQQQELHNARKFAEEARAAVSPDKVFESSESVITTAANGQQQSTTDHRLDQASRKHDIHDSKEQNDETTTIRHESSDIGDEKRHVAKHQRVDDDEQVAVREETDDASSTKEATESSDTEDNNSKEATADNDSDMQQHDDVDELTKLRLAAQQTLHHKKPPIVTDDNTHKMTSSSMDEDDDNEREVAGSKDDEPKQERKRRWGANRSLKRQPIVAVSADSLKDMMKEAEEEANVLGTIDKEQLLELDYEDDQQQQPVKKTIHRIVVAETDLKDDDEPDDQQQQHKAARTVVERGDESPVLPSDMLDDEHTTEDGLVRRKDVSPARYPVDRVLHIRCLTRPFTVKALMELLERFGTVLKDEFWIDTIKTNCLVKFKTTEGAELARSRLHNTVWPLSNPKCLRVDFASQEVLDRHLHGDKTTGGTTVETTDKEENGVGVAQITTAPKRDDRSLRRSPPTTGDRSARRRRHSPSPPLSKSKSNTTAEREWDRGKRFKPDESPPRTDTRKRSPERRPLREVSAEMAVRETKPPAKLLDDLFRKTKVTPCIYWLPLTDEQAQIRMAQKAEEKAKRAELRNERAAATNRRSPPSPGPPSGSRRRPMSPPMRRR